MKVEGVPVEGEGRTDGYFGGNVDASLTPILTPGPIQCKTSSRSQRSLAAVGAASSIIMSAKYRYLNLSPNFLH